MHGQCAATTVQEALEIATHGFRSVSLVLMDGMTSAMKTWQVLSSDGNTYTVRTHPLSCHEYASKLFLFLIASLVKIPMKHISSVSSYEIAHIIDTLMKCIEGFYMKKWILNNCDNQMINPI